MSVCYSVMPKPWCRNAQIHVSLEPTLMMNVVVFGMYLCECAKAPEWLVLSQVDCFSPCEFEGVLVIHTISGLFQSTV